MHFNAFQLSRKQAFNDSYCWKKSDKLSFPHLRGLQSPVKAWLGSQKLDTSAANASVMLCAKRQGATKQWIYGVNWNPIRAVGLMQNFQLS